MAGVGRQCGPVIVSDQFLQANGKIDDTYQIGRTAGVAFCMAQQLADQRFGVDAADVDISGVSFANVVTVEHHDKIIDDQKTAAVSFIVQLLLVQMVQQLSFPHYDQADRRIIYFDFAAVAQQPEFLFLCCTFEVIQSEDPAPAFGRTHQFPQFFLWSDVVDAVGKGQEEGEFFAAAQIDQIVPEIFGMFTAQCFQAKDSQQHDSIFDQLAFVSSIQPVFCQRQQCFRHFVF